MVDKIFVGKPIENKPFYMSPVEIIIPFHNEQSKVIDLINDIFITVQKNMYVITLVDDGSDNKNFLKQLREKRVEGLRFLSHDKCKGFGASVNTALKNPHNKNIPFVVIMHSDVRVKDNNWLFNLGQTLVSMKNNGVKMISSLTDNPMADVAALCGEKGVVKNDVVLSNGYLPMYCVIANRELFNRIGFLKEFPYAGTEAEEFAYRMRSKGFKQGVCGSSWVHHIGGATLKQYENDKKVNKILRNTYEEYLLTHKNTNDNNI